MTRRFPARSALAALALVLTAPPARGQETPPAGARDSLPTGAALLARYVEALGGEAAIRRHRSRHDVGTFALPAQGVQGTFEAFAAAPNRLFIRIEVPGLGTVRSGYDGQVAWSINPAVGPAVLEGRALDQHREQAHFYAPLDRELFITSLETVEKATFEGRPCYKVKAVTRWGEEYFEFYDAETGLLAGSVRRQESPMGAVEVTTVVGEYKKFGDLMLPTRVVQRTMGLEQVLTLTSVEFDQVSDDAFTLPPEIQALVRPAQTPRDPGR